MSGCSGTACASDATDCNGVSADINGAECYELAGMSDYVCDTGSVDYKVDYVCIVWGKDWKANSLESPRVVWCVASPGVSASGRSVTNSGVDKTFGVYHVLAEGLVVLALVLMVPLIMMLVVGAMPLFETVLPSRLCSRLTCLWVRLIPVCRLLAPVLITGLKLPIVVWVLLVSRLQALCTPL